MQFISRAKKYTKYYKIFYKPNKNFLNLKINFIHYIEYGIKKNLILTSIQLKMLIHLLKMKIKPYKKLIKIKLKLFPDFGKTRKPRDIRMGRGKGEISERISFCKGGSIILSLHNLKNIPQEFIESIFYDCSTKLGVFTYFINYKFK